MANWQLSVTGGSSIDLNDSFNLQQHRRRSVFTEQVLDGRDGVVIDGESRREDVQNMVLRGFIQEGTAAESDTKYFEIDALMGTRESNLNLIHIPTSTSYHVQHGETISNRRGGGLLEVIITLRVNITIN